MKTYDLVVIGSGTAAQVASARVRKAGRTVAVVDHRPFGGTCALRGCDPKKMLISGAEAVDAARRMQGHGVAGELRINWPELIAFKRTFTDPVPQKQEARYAEQGIDAFHGLARFADSDAVTAAGQELKARHILIATDPERHRTRTAASVGPPLTPVSGHDGKVVATNILEGNRHKPDHRGVPSVAFTVPPIASVGLSESQAQAQGLKFKVKSENTPDWVYLGWLQA
jgi:pyruvate/2-oxoglutarate dehydrogenase complex dihydrolipoamide dehydrogenase (E3) component